MPPNNGVIERMKAATHILVTMEIERAPEPIRDQDAFRRVRLPKVYAEHEEAWRQAYMIDPTITVNQFVTMVCGFRYESQSASRTLAEQNMINMRKLAAETPNIERNLTGIERARRALRRQT